MKVKKIIKPVKLGRLKKVAAIDKKPKNVKAKKTKGLKYVIVRTYSAGVFAGELQSRKGQEVILKNARRIHYWEGAASLSQLAMEGTCQPGECRFPCEVDHVELLQAIEILNVTDKARKSIKGVKIWKITA